MDQAIPFSHPARTDSGFRPLKALHHFRKLIADKEDTEQVFHIIRALSGNSFTKRAREFWSSSIGKSLLAEPQNLVEILDDHKSLRKLPMGTVAHAYCDFMEREGLSAQGLVDELDKYRPADMYFNDQVDWYFRRLRDTHDLMHVLTGYGRDALGEQCVLAFTYSQQPALAHLFLGYAGAYEIARRATVKVPVFRAVREGQKSGKACPRLVEMSIRELLAMPLEDARQKLGISQGRYYKQAHAMWRAAGIDPYDLMAPVKKAA